jgi:hypothetical protein
MNFKQFHLCFHDIPWFKAQNGEIFAISSMEDLLKGDKKVFVVKDSESDRATVQSF